MKYPIFILFFLLSFLTEAQERIKFNADWKFQLGDTEYAKNKDYNDSSWRVLTLPHDWAIEGSYNKENPSGVFGGYLRGGIGWYRKTIKVPDDWKNKTVEIAFDGVFRNSIVYANGEKLGFRPYGYVSFAYDVTETIAQSDSICFAVRVDNDLQPAARWYTGSGIYADTWLTIKNKIHVPRNGIFVRTIGDKVFIDTKISNKTSYSTDVIVTSSIKNKQDRSIASTKQNISLGALNIVEHKQEFNLKNPELWSPESPTLYTLETVIKEGSKVLDKVETRFGVRDIKWIPETGMWLNGKNIKLRGVCNHQSAGALGAAVPDKILRFRLQQLKDMGCNAIRTAHNAQTPKFYELCDEMGMMVMDEFFDGWHKKAEHDYGAHDFEEWWKRDLTSLIERDRNHPCVVIYSVGNESHGEYGKEIVELCHSIDNTRSVTSGHAGSDDMDVLGENGGSEKKGYFETLSNDRAFIGTENVHTWQNRGFYRTQMMYRDGYPGESGDLYSYSDLAPKEVFTYDWTDGSDRTNARQTLRSSYDNFIIGLTVRHNIEKLRDIKNFAGSFRWTGYDYLGEVKYHGGWPFKSFSGGAIDMANFKKDLFYLYQSQWTEKPMVHILPHWTHPTMKLGTEIPVWVYSNCQEVELFFNDLSLGKQKPGRMHEDMQCEWMIPWKPGTIKAVAYIDGKISKEQIIRTAEYPSNIELSIDGKPLQNEKNDIVQVRVTTTDAKGEFYPYGENRTYFHVFGPAHVCALDNGSPIDKESYFEANNRIGFFGLTRGYIKSDNRKGNVALLTGCILGEKKLITSTKVSISTKTLNLRGKNKKQKIHIYYTIDGSIPTTNSTKYSNAFDVELGTTVKALVVSNEEPLFVMEERFAQDEGFAWHANDEFAILGGDQAEDAKHKSVKLDTDIGNYFGEGYLVFQPENKEKGFIEWYFENDRDDGEFLIKLRYTTPLNISGEQEVKLSINDENTLVSLPEKRSSKRMWSECTQKVNLRAGSNYIRLLPIDVNQLCIDEITVTPVK